MVIHARAGSEFKAPPNTDAKKHVLDRSRGMDMAALAARIMPCKLNPPQRRVGLCQQPSPAHARTPLDDHFDRVQTRPVHARASRAIAERSGYDRWSGLHAKRAKPQPLMQLAITNLLPAPLCIAVPMAITTVTFQHSKPFWALRAAAGASCGLTQTKTLPASQRTAASTRSADAREPRRGR